MFFAQKTNNTQTRNNKQTINKQQTNNKQTINKQQTNKLQSSSLILVVAKVLVGVCYYCHRCYYCCDCCHHCCDCYLYSDSCDYCYHCCYYCCDRCNSNCCDYCCHCCDCHRWYCVLLWLSFFVVIRVTDVACTRSTIDKSTFNNQTTKTLRQQS